MWRHIRTHENPADLISRGLPAGDLVNNRLWWHGPQWLCQKQVEWPEPLKLHEQKQPAEVKFEMKINAVTRRDELQIFVSGFPEKVALFDYTKNLGEIERVLSYVIRFINKCKAKYAKRPLCALSTAQLEENVRQYVPFPTKNELKQARQTFIEKEQSLAYSQECKYLKMYGNKAKAGQFPERSKILNLNPYMDEDGIIRADGRIGEADLPYDTKYPIIVPPHSRLSRAIILQAHRKLMHGGTQAMIQYIRATYWIPRLRSEIKFFTLNALVMQKGNTQINGKLASGPN